MIRQSMWASRAACLAIITLAAGGTGHAATPAPLPQPAASYADLADLADSAPLVLRAQVRKLVPLEPQRAQGVRRGWARFYAEARTGALLAGDAVVGEALRYLVDLPLDGRGKPPATPLSESAASGRFVPVGRMLSNLWSQATQGFR